MAAKKAGVPYVPPTVERSTSDPEPLPVGGERLWSLFYDLSNARGTGFSGPEAISWADIQAYNAMAGVEIERWEAAAIRALDNAYLTECAEMAEERRDKGGKREGGDG
jgi:hypothetical protein